MSGWLALAITTIMVLVSYLLLNRSIVVRTSRQAALEEIKREVGAIITELNATSERNIELIEDRIQTLEKLIAQADRRVGALRRNLTAQEAESDTYRRLGRLPASPQSADERTDDSASNVGKATETGGASGAPVGPSDARSGTPPEPPEVSARERVRGLYLQGVALERIASIVGKTVGEVELIVALDEGVKREQ